MLTPAQQATLKTYIQNDATLNAQPNNNTGNGEIANALNATASPAFCGGPPQATKSRSVAVECVLPA